MTLKVLCSDVFNEFSSANAAKNIENVENFLILPGKTFFLQMSHLLRFWIRLMRSLQTFSCLLQVQQNLKIKKIRFFVWTHWERFFRIFYENGYIFLLFHQFSVESPLKIEIDQANTNSYWKTRKPSFDFEAFHKYEIYKIFTS